MPMFSISSPQQRAPDWTRHVAVFQNSESEYGSPPRNWDTMTICESPFPPGQLTPCSTKSPHTPRTPRSSMTMKKFKNSVGNSQGLTVKHPPLSMHFSKKGYVHVFWVDIFVFLRSIGVIGNGAVSFMRG